jgi:hypothetical protein
MAKTLKDFLNERQLGPMVVKNPDEQKFIDKHVIAKTDDRNGNDDELFKGSKVKMADRPKHRKGYNPGEDEEVYEELKGNQHKIDANKNGKVDAHDFHLLRKKKKVAEEAEELDELSEPTVRTYYNKAGEQGKKIADKMKMGGGDWSKDGSDTKTLKKRAAGRTMALKRRSGEIKMSEEVEELEELSDTTLDNYKEKAAKEIRDADDNDDNRHYNKRMHGYTSALKAGQRNNKKTTKEEAEQIDEISAEKKDAYAQKAGKQLPGLFAKSASADGARKYYNRKNAVRKIANEEAEQVNEKLDMKKASMGTVVKDFQKSDAPQFMGKSQKKRQVMAVAAKLTAERGGKPLNKEERLLTKLADLAETHKRTMVSVFEKLNEDNQHAFMQACDTADGIEQMLDFSISYRGE